MFRVGKFLFTPALVMPNCSSLKDINSTLFHFSSSEGASRSADVFMYIRKSHIFDVNNHISIVLIDTFLLTSKSFLILTKLKKFFGASKALVVLVMLLN